MSEPDVSDLLTVAQAIAIIDATPVQPRIVEVPLGDADGLVLAQDIRADRDYPPFDKSLMDGYAVRCADVAQTPVELRVIGEIAAGTIAARGVAKGEAFAIMTGAPMPDGADGVVPVEDTQRVGDNLRIAKASAPDRFITRRGNDIGSGAVVLEGGMKLGPAQLAVAASVGAARVKAFAKPRAAVLSTGDELVAIDQTPGPAQIRNSNSIMLASLLRKLGCDVIDLGIVRDDPAATREALLHGMQHELLFVTGGMSMGDYDYVPRTLIELGATLHITKLRIKPGKPFVFGTKNEHFVFGLPGNPLAGFVCTVRLASRLIARLRGEKAVDQWRDVKLGESLPPNGPREFYQPVLLQSGVAKPLKWKGSADVFTLARANALLVRAENEPALETGAAVRVLEV
jgi:molybdopterin molybdotransferase